ncbi:MULTISPECIES: sce7726 family protein [Sphingobacterium]|uniref:sce7726 family protein n=1 Tax=Sphingobacterium TaxID=28453 RepID=UPI0028A5F0C8|nr:sce7726 family protein [Sphingobacterium multivorum]
MKDPEIRKIFKDSELAHYINDDNSKVIDELNLPVAKARIDIALVNGSLHGFEIKSASDTLKRLPDQIEAYTKIFDYLSVITEDKYLQKIQEVVPKWVGLFVCIEVKGKIRVKRIRKAKVNKEKQGFFLAKLLWREELIDILTELQIPFRKKDRNWILCEILATNLCAEKLSKIVRDRLKGRSDWRSYA